MNSAHANSERHDIPSAIHPPANRRGRRSSIRTRGPGSRSAHPPAATGCESARWTGPLVLIRVTHCCFEHAGQNFGSLDRGPQATRPGMCGCGWRTSELRSKPKQRPVPEEIPDAEHELVIERVCAIDVAKASGTVCVRTPRRAAAGQQGVGRGGHHRRGHRPGRSADRAGSREGHRGVHLGLRAT